MTLGGDSPREINGALVTCNYFGVLRIVPAVGPGFTSANCEAPDAPPSVVLSHALWTAGQLVVRGDDLIRELGLRPGPVVGRLLGELMEAVLDDPAANDREALLALARASLARDPEGVPGGAGTHQARAAPHEPGP